MSPLYILEKIEDDLADCGRLAFSDRALAFGRANLRCLAAFGASIADAKNAAIGKPRGDVAASDDGIGTQHSGTPTKHPHLRSVYS